MDSQLPASSRKQELFQFSVPVDSLLQLSQDDSSSHSWFLSSSSSLGPVGVPKSPVLVWLKKTRIEIILTIFTAICIPIVSHAVIKIKIQGGQKYDAS